MLNNKYNVVLILVILIILFSVITYLKSTNTKEKSTEQNINKILTQQKTCEELCTTSNCFAGCYSTLINVAIAEKNIAKCNEINNKETKQSCFDQVNLALKNCDKILNKGLKDICQS